ncbi:ferrous iron transport protein B [Butyricicoccus faecihominis]|uniref:ferrous iron transport protein B n=1 Tax=Butyricicoccus faecihominis TaxID=1712515 RepID=UPI0024793644|nr:ferrous iron transport protein B [Butyricicoccus faecihominis]MCQ5128126.1 ferrous iron transport protein B [Butyricicoccus faecihominis]
MKKRTLAIIGNPNSGKTTLFNRLTGANQHVGNWPGVTVDRKSGGVCYKGTSVELVDLPGIYSLSPYTQEEIIAREYVLSDELDGILNIVDAANIERNLYLTLQLIALGLPMVVALGFMDDVRAQGIEIDCAALSERLGVPVVPISAKKGENMDELLSAITGEMRPPARQPAYLHGVSAAIRRAATLLEPLPLRRCSLSFYAAKLLEGDEKMREQVDLPRGTRDELHAIAAGMHSHANSTDNEMVLADALYDYIEEIVAASYRHPHGRKITVTERIDKIVLHRFWALPIFAFFMFLMFWSTFGPIGSALADGMEYLLQGLLAPAVRGALTTVNAQGWLIGLLCDGVIGGVGGVLSFLPQIVILFFYLSILEDTGYLARVAFIMDTLLRRIGLSGKSFVPMLMGFGCTTPAVLAARTMENEKDRRMTIMLTPFMSCGAKLPVYALVAGAVFKEHQGLIILSLYVLGILVGILAGFILKKTVFRGVSSGFVLELPTYRMPSFKGTVLNMWQKAKDFITKAGTIIFLMSVVIWLLQNFTLSLAVAGNSAESILGVLGAAIAPVFGPLGFGHWQESVALLTGLVAKEAVVSTMSVLYGAAGDSAMLSGLIGTVFTPLSGYAFLTFTLLYMPCMSAFATIRREMGGWRWALGAAAFQTGLAYIVALVIYQVGGLFL